MNMQGLIKRMKRMTPPQTPGAKNPTSQIRSRTMGAGKSVVPAKAATPTKVKQGNPKGKRSVKSMPVGFKGAKVTHLKGGKGMSMPGRIRGGYGAARPNLGFAAATKPIGPVAGSGGTGKR